MAVRRPSRSRFVLLLLILTAGTVITLSYRSQANQDVSRVRGWVADAFDPVDRAVVAAFRPVGNFFKGAFDYGSLRSQNAQLRSRIAALQGRSADGPDQRRQLAELLALDHLPFAPALAKVPAEVIATTFSNFQITVELDRGAAQGVATGMPVVTGAGLAGRVVDVARTTCTVLLVTDPTSSIGVRAGGAIGVASGQGPGRTLRVDYLAPGSPIHKGSVMFTSGLEGSIYPPGIPVGRVSLKANPPNSLQLEVAMRPLADLSQMQFVDILRWEPPG